MQISKRLFSTFRSALIRTPHSLAKKLCLAFLLSVLSAGHAVSADSLREKLLNEFRSFFGGNAPVPAEENEKNQTETEAKASPEEKNVVNTKFAKVYTQIIRAFHPRMLRFDYLHNGFVEGELKNYARPGHYAGLPDLLKGQELSPESEKSHLRCIALADTDLKRNSGQENESEEIQAEISDIIEKIRLNRKLLMILHENINPGNDPFEQQRRLMTPDLPDLTTEVLRTIYQNYGMSDRESQELLEHIDSIQNR
jgi:hypothetical protein